MKFEEFFEGVYGARWPAIYRALRAQPVDKVLLQNPFGLQDYQVDPASLGPAEALGLEAGHSVADFCSAPGGKLIAALFAAAKSGGLNGVRVKANDLSPARVQRLKAVLHDCLPPEILKQIEVSRGDASRWGMKFPAQFDRVLIDAPCSGERHLLKSPQEADRWSQKSSKRLAVRQHALLCAGLDSAVSGGRVVYSTCSISPLENDGVIERLEESRAGLFRILPAPPGAGEATRYGRLVLPDAEACGPIYTAVLEKI
jgi:16S rRNA C967 or C1407 C5-methylase (RsmB/RsmF family)